MNGCVEVESVGVQSVGVQSVGARVNVPNTHPITLNPQPSSPDAQQLAPVGQSVGKRLDEGVHL